MASRSIVVVEGIHDMAAYGAICERLLEVEGRPLPAASHVVLVDAGAVEGAGGAGVVPDLCRLARGLGFRTIAVLDHDGEGDQAQKEVEAALAGADCVVRLPAGHAVERALVHALGDGPIRAALGELRDSFDATLPANISSLTAEALEMAAVRVIKAQKGGLHTQFVEALPAGIIPSEARAIVLAATGAAIDRTKSGLIAL
jgi:hypothetical protein